MDSGETSNSNFVLVSRKGANSLFGARLLSSHFPNSKPGLTKNARFNLHLTPISHFEDTKERKTVQSNSQTRTRHPGLNLRTS